MPLRLPSVYFGVSTHSRLKAAGFPECTGGYRIGGFNTQPPEGGWVRVWERRARHMMFQHTAA